MDGTLDEIVRHARLTNCFAAAAAVAWICDYSHMFPDEVELVWHSRTSIVKIVYLLNRLVAPILIGLTLYYSFDPTLQPHECQQGFLATGALGNISTLLSTSILYLHVHALSARKRWLGIYLSLQFAALCVMLAALSFVMAFRIGYEAMGVEGVNCVNFKLGEVGALFGAFCAISIGTEVVLVCITLYTMVCRYRGLKSSRLYRAVSRDGLIYPYTTIAFSVATTIIAFEAPNTPIKFILVLPKLVCHNVFSSRLILHLRRAAREHWGWSESGDGTEPLKFAPFTLEEGVSEVGASRTMVKATVAGDVESEECPERLIL